ncbi:M57 family metalloprotease [Xanthovirga aplysinae]|uniref:M57 family metalloprotease n=1 Tax=Xanthovirga aplysinae TaxID=2529853 RepID=UPI0012BCF706|nr:M57 family metalloprotease [Xanthovirga aplysinae]MTI31767.1 protease B [Xanthovirga aplysinae]
MKKILNLMLVGSMLFCIYSCEQPEEESPALEEVSSEIYDKLDRLGFNTVDYPVIKYNGQLIVENDIVINLSELDDLSNASQLPTAEQYSTNNLVTATPRTISVYVNSSFSQNYFDGTDEAIARYNAENLTLTFQRVSSSSQADIVINPSPWYYGLFGILGSAGFPTASGNPYDEILMTRSYYDGVTNIDGLATTIAHEMGHCIGFRHTDYMDRSFSCGGSPDDEGAGSTGANHIPGTPTGPEAGSWMLACGSVNLDRPFTSSDKTALDYLY